MEEESRSFEAFKRLYGNANELFNQGDLEAAWGTLPEEFVYYPPRNFPGTSVLRGPEQIIEHFRSVRAALPDSKGQAIEFVDTGEGKFFIHLRVSDAAPRTDAARIDDLFQVWEMDGAVPVSCREFTEREDALRAAGIEE